MTSKLDDVHDRTHRLAKLLGIELEAVRHLSARRVVLEIDPFVASTEVGKLAFLTLCNLATRLGPYAPNLDVLVPATATGLESPVYPASKENLRAQALWIMRSAVPAEDLVRGIADPKSNYDVAITIGGSAVKAHVRLHVAWEGWAGFVGPSRDMPLLPSDRNPFGALIAGAMAVARFHGLQLAAIGANTGAPQAGWCLNALTLGVEPGGPGPLSPTIRLPRLLLIGAGALGSSFTYAMTHVQGLSAEVDVVDPDVLTPSNANRQITATFDRTKGLGTYKVHDLAASWSAVRPIALTCAAVGLSSSRQLKIQCCTGCGARRATSARSVISWT